MPAGNTTSVYGNARPGQAYDRRVLAGLICVAILRSIALILTPLELGVDEAQYWLWSQTFDFGYFTKPPLTSWIIGLTHDLFGHNVWAVRIAAPWVHLGTALIIWKSAGWLYGAAAGRWAGALWMLLPAVSLGSFVISTDTPLLLFWAAALFFVIGVMCQRIRPHTGMFVAGLMLGGGMMAKYAAVYFLPGIVAFWLWQFSPRQPASNATFSAPRLTAGHIGLFVTGMVITASPNLIWNLLHDFTTVRHLGDNANLAQHAFNLMDSLLGSLAFFGTQFITAGPVCFALMLMVFRRPFDDPRHRLLICLCVPPLAVITVQAFLSEANANWALGAMPALVIWVAGWISRNPAIWGLFALAVNGGMAAVFLVASSAGTLGPITPQSDPLRRLKGWNALAIDVKTALVESGATTIIADRRATAALLSWHFHQRGITILVHDADDIPSNHFEANHAWQRTPGRLVVAVDGSPTPPPIEGIVWAELPALSKVIISPGQTRKLYLYQGSENAPAKMGPDDKAQ